MVVKRRRHLSAAQKRAGFGGKRLMHTRRAVGGRRHRAGTRRAAVGYRARTYTRKRKRRTTKKSSALGNTLKTMGLIGGSAAAGYSLRSLQDWLALKGMATGPTLGPTPIAQKTPGLGYQVAPWTFDKGLQAAIKTFRPSVEKSVDTFEGPVKFIPDTSPAAIAAYQPYTEIPNTGEMVAQAPSGPEGSGAGFDPAAFYPDFGQGF